MSEIDETRIAVSLVGRTVVAADPYEGEDGCGYLGIVLTLDDGREIDFQGWGHDWCGMTIREMQVGAVS